MIGRPEWFKRRKYGGWGLTPKTWQAWAYILFMIVPMVAFQAIPYIGTELKLTLTLAWIAVLMIDTLDIMAHLKKDEREKMHEAIAERNAAWYMVAVLASGFAYELTVNAMEERLYVDPVIALALFGAVVVKAATNIYLERKG